MAMAQATGTANAPSRMEVVRMDVVASVMAASPISPSGFQISTMAISR